MSEEFDIKTATDEQIEAHVRKKAKDLPEGAYQIGYDDRFLAITGREGYILHEIAFAKLIRDGAIKPQKTEK